jgi:hypothetical protein
MGSRGRGGPENKDRWQEIAVCVIKVKWCRMIRKNESQVAKGCLRTRC